MTGRIYISGAFTNLNYVRCKPNKDWLDNDPHFWKMPPTWGICRTDYRKMLNQGDYIFFVLPAGTTLPQTIYGYFKIAEHITHDDAYQHYPAKRMRSQNPNGNIIVDGTGNYNRFDENVHRKKFEAIRKHYIVGDRHDMAFLKKQQIESMAPQFLAVLNNVFVSNASTIFQIIGRKGRVLNNLQTGKLLQWINDGRLSNIHQ